MKLHTINYTVIINFLQIIGKKVILIMRKEKNYSKFAFIIYFKDISNSIINPQPNLPHNCN